MTNGIANAAMSGYPYTIFADRARGPGCRAAEIETSPRGTNSETLDAAAKTGQPSRNPRVNHGIVNDMATYSLFLRGVRTTTRTPRAAMTMAGAVMSSKGSFRERRLHTADRPQYAVRHRHPTPNRTWRLESAGTLEQIVSIAQDHPSISAAISGGHRNASAILSDGVIHSRVVSMSLRSVILPLRRHGLSEQGDKNSELRSWVSTGGM